MHVEKAATASAVSDSTADVQSGEAATPSTSAVTSRPAEHTHPEAPIVSTCAAVGSAAAQSSTVGGSSVQKREATLHVISLKSSLIRSASRLNHTPSHVPEHTK